MTIHGFVPAGDLGKGRESFQWLVDRGGEGGRRADRSGEVSVGGRGGGIHLGEDPADLAAVHWESSSFGLRAEAGSGQKGPTSSTCPPVRESHCL